MNHKETHGGDIVAHVLKQNEIDFVFTLCGGHISPILTGCENIGIRVLDVRNEATAVFAADAVSRISGNIGIAIVTAGPGLTNTITAIKNAQMAQVPIVIISGATATVLKNKGSLQDIDHISIVRSLTKFSGTVKSVKDIRPLLHGAIEVAQSDLPGPVYLEIPVDILYSESIVREWYGLKSKSSSMPWWLTKYLNWNVNRIFKNKNQKYIQPPSINQSKNIDVHLNYLSEILNRSDKPLLLLGSQANIFTEDSEVFIESLKKLNIPICVSGMSRGFLSKDELPIYRHERKKALKESDLVILVGVPCDFRLDYGRVINHRAKLISVNLSYEEMYLNRRPDRAILCCPNSFIVEWAQSVNKNNQTKWNSWNKIINDRNQERQIFIESQAEAKTDFVNPIDLFVKLNSHIEDGDIIIGDGGDFVATASYILKPRSLYGWMDPGVFGTLGVGAGFIMGAKLVFQNSIIWAIYGDGAFGYSLIEFDSFVRHKIPVIAIIGNDASWAQIARDQVDILGSSISTDLSYTEYHKAVEGLGGKGYLIDDINQLKDTIKSAKEDANNGIPVAINIKIGKTDFRKGSISM